MQARDVPPPTPTCLPSNVWTGGGRHRSRQSAPQFRGTRRWRTSKSPGARPPPWRPCGALRERLVPPPCRRAGERSPAIGCIVHRSRLATRRPPSNARKSLARRRAQGTGGWWFARSLPPRPLPAPGACEPHATRCGPHRQPTPIRLTRSSDSSTLCTHWHNPCKWRWVPP